MTRDPAAADHVTHEIFVRAWRALGSFRHESAIETWLHRIAVRTLIDHQRAAGAWQRNFTELDTDDIAMNAKAPESHTDDRMDLERAIGRLPKGAHAVLVLHDIEGFKYEEIASMLSVNVGTVKSQLNRARRLLIEWLNS